MGKKAKSKSSRLKAARESEAAEEFMDHVIEDRQQNVLEAKADSELFVIDKVGSKRKRRIASFMKEQKKKGLDKVSKHEKRKMEKMVQTKATKVVSTAPQEKEEGTYDLWGSGNTAESDNKTKRLSKHLSKVLPTTKKINMAAKKATVLSTHPGQSYNPQDDAHQDMLGMALAVELDRDEAIKQATAPLSTGLSELNKEILLDDEAYSSSDEEDSADRDKTQRKLPRRKKRADRNRQRRKKFDDLKAAEEKRNKTILKDINRLKEITKDLEKEEEESQQRQEIVKKWREEAAEENLLVVNKDPMKANSLVVPLSDELHGNMRQMKNKGSLLKEQMQKFISVGAVQPKLNKKSRRPRRQKYRTIQTQRNKRTTL